MAKQGDTHVNKSQHEVFLDHYGALSKVLSASISNLTPHFISARILSVSDQEEITKQTNPDDKVLVLLKKVSAALENGYCKSFNKMLSLMSIYGNNDVKDLSQTLIRSLPDQVVAPVQDNAQQDKCNTPDDASVEFNAVVFDIAEILENELKHTGDIKKFKCLCYGLTTNDQLFFSTAEKDAIRACKTFHDLFAEIHRSIRWDSHRLLTKITVRAHVPEATNKLEQFERKINCQIKLKDIFDTFEADDKGPPDGYTEMVAIIDKDYAQITVDEYEKIEDFLSTHFSDPPPAKRAKYNSVQLTWYIPTAAVLPLLMKAYQAREYFTLQPTIVYLSISGVMVWDKDSVYTPQVLKARQEEIDKAKQEITELSEKMDQCNLDLKTAHNDIAVKESEKKELQENLKKANDEADKVPKLQEQIKELSTKVTQLEDKEKSLDEEVEKHKSELEERKKKVDELDEKLKVVKASRDEYIKELDAKNAELSDVMSKAREQIDSIRQDLDKITAEKNKLEKEYSALLKSNTGTQTSKDDLIKELQTKNTELSSGRDKDKRQFDEIQRDMEKVTTDKNKLESECARLQQINVEMKCNEEKLRKEIKNKDEELSRMQGGQVQEHPKAKQPVTQSTDTNRVQQSIIIMLRNQVKELTVEIVSLKSRNDSLTQERKQLLDQIEFLRKPKELDPGIGPSLPGSRRTTGEVGLDSGIGWSRPTTGEQPYVPKDS